MTLTASDKKKLPWLIGLGVVAVIAVYTQLLSGPSIPSQPVAVTPVTGDPVAMNVPSPSPAAAPRGATGAPRRAGAKKSGEEFHPVLHPKRPEDRLDPVTVDPTLFLERLAKLQNVTPSTNGRNLFQFGAPPPKEPDKTLPAEPTVAVARVYGPKYIPPPPPPGPTPEPPLPPIPYKYYGYATARINGKTTGFFMEGDEIILAAEGETVKKRYRVIRLSKTSVVLEDLEYKGKQKQQTLPLAEEATQS